MSRPAVAGRSAKGNPRENRWDIMGGDWLSLVLIAGVFAVFLLLRRGPGGG
jgi:hypothetical protein